MTSQIAVFSLFLEKDPLIKAYNDFCREMFSYKTPDWGRIDVFLCSPYNHGNFSLIEKNQDLLAEKFGEEVYDFIDVARSYDSEYPRAMAFTALLYSHCLVRYYEKKDFELFWHPTFDICHFETKELFDLNIIKIGDIISSMNDEERMLMFWNFEKVVTVNGLARMPPPCCGITQENFPLHSIVKYPRRVFVSMIVQNMNVLIERTKKMQGGAERLADAIMYSDCDLNDNVVDSAVLTHILNMDLSTCKDGDSRYRDVLGKYLLVQNQKRYELGPLTPEAIMRLRCLLTEILGNKYKSGFHESAEFYNDYLVERYNQ